MPSSRTPRTAGSDADPGVAPRRRRIGKRLKDALGARTASGAAADGAGGSAGVLVVDDDESVRAMCAAALIDEGFAVVSLASAREALEASFAADDVALVVLDLSLPGAADVAWSYAPGAGWPARPDAREADPPVRQRSAPSAGLLLISGHEPGDFGVDPHDVAFLAKPFTPAELLDAVRSSPASCSSRTRRTRGGQLSGPLRFDTRDGQRVPAGTPIGAAGAATVRSSRERRGLVASGVALTVLVAGGVVVVAGGGGPDQEAVAGAPRPTTAAPGSERSDDEAATERSRDDDGTGPSSSPRPVVALDADPTPGASAGAADTASATGPASTPETAPSTAPTSEPSPLPVAAASPVSDAMVGYLAPDEGDPKLSRCSRHDGADHRAEYTVEFTVEFTGGNYDVLPGEPFLDNDRTVEVRGGTLVWTVVATHIASHDDGDAFEVTAPSAFGWADPGTSDRRHSYLPPPLSVPTDACRP